MTIQDYQKRHGLTYKQVYDRIRNKDIPARKVKGQWDIIDRAEDKAAGIKADGTPDGRMTQGGRLKDALTAVQIKKIQQQLKEGEYAIISEWLDGKEGVIGFRQRLLESFEPLRRGIDDARLTDDQSRAINAGLNEAIKRCEQLKI